MSIIRRGVWCVVRSYHNRLQYIGTELAEARVNGSWEEQGTYTVITHLYRISLATTQPPRPTLIMLCSQSIGSSHRSFSQHREDVRTRPFVATVDLSPPTHG